MMTENLQEMVSGINTQPERVMKSEYEIFAMHWNKETDKHLLGPNKTRAITPITNNSGIPRPNIHCTSFLSLF
jgi:hypothetical protein